MEEEGAKEAKQAKQALPVALNLYETLPAALDAGAPFALAVALTTQAGCDLAGAAFRVLQGEEAVASGILPPVMRIDPEGDDYDPRNGPVDLRDHVRIVLCAPRAIGTYEWTLVLPEQEHGGVRLAAATLGFSIATGEHRTSLAAWDVPSPVVAGERFSFKAGAKCSACCALAGRRIELRDASGSVVATGALGEAAWPEAPGLYWTELSALAPRADGLHEWSISFAADDHALPHQGAAATISFVVAPAGRHRVSVAVVDRQTRAPIPEAQVRLGHHRRASDEAGVARFSAPPGQQRLFVWKAEFAIPEQTIDVDHDLDLVVEAEALPPEDPYARWQG